MSILSELSSLSDDVLEKTSARVSSAQKKKEIETVLRWQKDKNQKDFEYLWKSLQPIINKQVDKYSYGSPVPRPAFKGETMKLFVKALKTYKSNMGTALSSHVHNYMQKLYRFNLKHQNIARISSEAVAAKITMYDNRKKFLEDRLSRPPTGIELADDLGWSIKDVNRMEQDISRKDIAIGSQHWVTGENVASSRFMDKLNTLYMFETNPKEKLVLEYIYGFGGKQKIKSNIQIARMIGITPNRVSQIRGKLAKKIKGKM